MNLSKCRVVVGALVLNVALSLAGCAQFTTSRTERDGLQSVADAAGTAYLDCLNEQASRYLGTNEDARAIVTIARKNCAGERDAAARAQSALQDTNYILAGSQVEASLKALDDKGEAAITEQVLNRKAATPAMAAAVPAASTVPAANGGSAEYLACMQSQGERWATVQEPATVIADTAHNRCASRLAGSASAAATEQQGRALVMGLVLDRKAQAPGTSP